MKKLIEVALPLEAINAASAREKSIRHGHPSTLHLWWARRPLAAARAVIFSQMVDDPSEYVEELLVDSATRAKAEKEHSKQLKVWETKKQVFDKTQAWSGPETATTPDPGPTPTLEGVAAQLERERLFAIIEQLVLWENTTNEKVLQAARDEIWRSWRRTCKQNADHPRAAELFNPEKLPAFHDPFAGGGALPLEAQRLGLESYASDLNPVAVLINKAMIEIPPKFAGMPPVNPNSRIQQRHWKGAEGLAEDVRYYGQWMRDEAEKRIGHLYPKVEITAEMARERPDLKQYVGQKLTVIAWIWARTVKSPNPAFAHVDVPLASTFMLFTKPGKEAYVEPIIERDGFRFRVKVGKPKDVNSVENGTKLARGANFQCIMSGVPIDQSHIHNEFKAKRSGVRMMAIVAEGENERIYLSPTIAHVEIAQSARPSWYPEQEMNQETSNLVSGRGYGITHWHEIFTNRQLVTLTTLSNLIQEVHEKIKNDAITVESKSSNSKVVENNFGFIIDYANSVVTYLGLAVSKQTVFLVTQARWRSGEGKSAPAFGRQALPMVWDFADVNPFAGAGGDFSGIIEGIKKALQNSPPAKTGTAVQANAMNQELSINHLISTDPPYYDNIGYADLSDFFYIWLRQSLKPFFSNLFSTVVVPKADELIAAPYRHGGKEKAEIFFLDGMKKAMRCIADQAHSAFPVTIYYAFRQTESDDEGIASTGWDTFLEAVILAGFAISGTWPMRTENQTRLVGMTTNALASSIVLVCHKRPTDLSTATRREFVSTLKTELPAALAHLQAGNIAPVDLAQAAIGPGMAVYTRYAKVLDAQGQPLSVRQALALINETLDEALAEQEGDFDADTRWALAWFEQNGFSEGEYGVAETLSKAKDTSVAGMVEAGILASGKGKVRLLKPAELPEKWDPAKDPRLTAWEMVHHLVRVLESKGESAASELSAKLGVQVETARELCYRLYTICERKKRNAEALSYNALVQSWPEINRLAREVKPEEKQASLF